MRIIIFLVLILGIIQGRVCQTQTEIDAIPMKRGIEYDITSQNHIFGVISHPSLEILYFIVQMKDDKTGPELAYMSILKTDYDIKPEKLISVQGDPSNVDKTISSDGEYIYAV